MPKSTPSNQMQEKHESTIFASVWLGTAVAVVVGVAVAFIIVMYGRP